MWPGAGILDGVLAQDGRVDDEGAERTDRLGRKALRLVDVDEQAREHVHYAELETGEDGAGQLRRPDGVARVAGGAEDVPGWEAQDEGQVAAGDVDRASPGGLERHVREGGKQGTELPCDLRDEARVPLEPASDATSQAGLHASRAERDATVGRGAQV